MKIGDHITPKSVNPVPPNLAAIVKNFRPPTMGQVYTCKEIVEGRRFKGRYFLTIEEHSFGQLPSGEELKSWIGDWEVLELPPLDELIREEVTTN